MKLLKIFSLTILFNCFFLSFSYSEIVKEIRIDGNKRITDEIISMFSDIEIGQDVKSSDVNKVIKKSFNLENFDR